MAQRADAPLELAAIAGVLEDLLRPKQLLADPQARLAEFLFGAQPLGAVGEVALEM